MAFIFCCKLFEYIFLLIKSIQALSIYLFQTFEDELKNRGLSLESVCKTADDLKKEASPSDIESITAQVDELNTKWKSVIELNEARKRNLDEALHLVCKMLIVSEIH